MGEVTNVTPVYEDPRTKPNRRGVPDYCFTVTRASSRGKQAKTYKFDSREEAEAARELVIREEQS